MRTCGHSGTVLGVVINDEDSGDDNVLHMILIKICMSGVETKVAGVW